MSGQVGLGPEPSAGSHTSGQVDTQWMRKGRGVGPACPSGELGWEGRHLGNLPSSPYFIDFFQPSGEVHKAGAAGQGGKQKDKCLITIALWSKGGWVKYNKGKRLSHNCFSLRFTPGGKAVCLLQELSLTVKQGAESWPRETSKFTC